MNLRAPLRERIRNWDGTQTWRPEVVHHPSSEAEVAAIVRQAAERGGRVKAHGGSLSWSDIIDVPQAAMRLDRMARVLEVDPLAQRVTVQGGARLRDVNEALAARGQAFDNFGSIVMQTAAGYTGTGTHGTGGRTRILSSHIERMRLVDGRGEIHELSATSEPELFAAARVHLGCLGVVTEITFRTVDAFDLEERLELVDFDTALADLETHIAANDYFKLWWIPYTSKIQLYRFNRTTQPRTRQSFSERLDTTGISGAAYTALLGLSRHAPIIIPRLNETIQRFQFKARARIDRSDRIIRVATAIPVHQETEYAIPRVHAGAAIEEIRRFVERASPRSSAARSSRAAYHVNFPLEVRFVAKDDIPMSPASGRDSCYLGAYIASETWAVPYFADFENLMTDYAGRPHWGKTFTRTHRQMRQLYPEYDRFDALRRAADPAGVFHNRFVERVFAPGQSPVQ